MDYDVPQRCEAPQNTSFTLMSHKYADEGKQLKIAYQEERSIEQTKFQ